MTERVVRPAGAARDVPIGPMTTYGVGGRASWLVEVSDRRALAELAAELAGGDLPLLVVGRGSNLLVSDAGFPGVAVRLGDGFTHIEVDAGTVRAGGAVSLPVLARHTVGEGLTGLEWAVGVPGSVGGGVRMNAGGHGSDMAASLVDAEIVDLRSGRTETRAAADLDLAYRHSNVGAHEVVTEARFALAAGDAEAGRRELSEIVAWRRAHQPGGHNAGSVFTNPAGDSAGRLIEAAGLKGHRIGSAEVSTKHANFIQADEEGRAADVLALMAHVRRVVHETSGVLLHPETRFAGFSPTDLAPVTSPLPPGGSP